MGSEFLLEGQARIDVAGLTNDLNRAIEAVTNRTRSIGNLNTSGFSQPLGRITGQASEFTKSLDAANARVIAFGASAGAIMAVKVAFGAMLTNSIEVEDSLVKINTLLGLTKLQLSSFGSQLFETANRTSTAFKDAADAATEFSRQGLNQVETLKRVDASLTLAKLSGLGYEDSVKSITAAMNSFGSEVMSAMEVVDRFAAVDARFAVSAADLALAVSRVGSSAGDAKVEFNELLAVVAAAQQITARGGAVIGNSLKTIFTRMERPAVISQLELLGIKTRESSGDILPMMQILKNLATEYDSLSEAQKSQTSELIGGVFQINILKATLRDLANGTSIYDGALKAANQSSGEATKRINEQNETIKSKLIVSMNKLKEASSGVGDLIFKPTVSSGLNFVNDFLSSVSSSLNSKTPDMIDSLGKSILEGMGKVISGPGLQLLTFSFLKLASQLGRFSVDSASAFLGITSSATERLAIEKQTLDMLNKHPEILERVLRGTESISIAARNALGFHRNEIALMGEKMRIAERMAAIMHGSGLSVSSAGQMSFSAKAGGLSIGKSTGFVPNFNNSQIEESTARSLGASSGVRAHMGKGTIGGRRFLMNNEETEIPNFGGGRDSAVIPHYYNGYSNGHPNGIGEKDLMSPRTRIERLKKMLDAGQLSQADYNRARARRSNENAVVQNGILTIYNNGKMTMGYATMDESEHYVKDAKTEISPKNLGTTAYNRLLELFPGQIKENMHVVISGMNYAPIKLSQKEFQRISADKTGHSFESLMFGPKYRSSNDVLEVEDAQKWLGKTRAKRYNLTNVFGGFELKINKKQASTASAASKFINQYFSGGHIPNFSNRHEDFLEGEYPYTLGSDRPDGKDMKKRYRDSLKTGVADEGNLYNASFFRSQGNAFPGLTTKRYVRMNPKTFGADASNSIDYYSDTKTIKVNYLSNYRQSPGGARGLYRLFSTLAKRGAKKIDAGYIVGGNVPNIKKLADKLGMEIYGNTGSSLTPQEAAKLTQGSETLEPGGYESGFSYKPKSYAGGHLQKAIAREISSGYSASQVRIGRDDSLVSDLNPSGIGVFNSTEGSLSNGIAAARRAGINPKNKGAANGHIPNFAEESSGGIGASLSLGLLMFMGDSIRKVTAGFGELNNSLAPLNARVKAATNNLAGQAITVSENRRNLRNNINDLRGERQGINELSVERIENGAQISRLQSNMASRNVSGLIAQRTSAEAALSAAQSGTLFRSPTTGRMASRSVSIRIAQGRLSSIQARVSSVAAENESDSRGLTERYARRAQIPIEEVALRRASVSSEAGVRIRMQEAQVLRGQGSAEKDGLRRASQEQAHAKYLIEQNEIKRVKTSKTGMGIAFGGAMLAGAMPQDSAVGKVASSALTATSLVGQVMATGLITKMSGLAGGAMIVGAGLYVLNEGIRAYYDKTQKINETLDGTKISVERNMSALNSYTQNLSVLEALSSNASTSLSTFARVQSNLNQSLADLSPAIRSRILAEPTIKGKTAIAVEASEDQAKILKSGEHRARIETRNNQADLFSKDFSNIAMRLLQFGSIGKSENLGTTYSSSKGGLDIRNTSLDQEAIDADAKSSYALSSSKAKTGSINILSNENIFRTKTSPFTGKKERVKSDEDILLESSKAGLISGEDYTAYTSSKDASRAAVRKLQNESSQRLATSAAQKIDSKKKTEQEEILRAKRNEISSLSGRQSTISSNLNNEITTHSTKVFSARQGQEEISRGINLNNASRLTSGADMYGGSVGNQTKLAIEYAAKKNELNAKIKNEKQARATESTGQIMSEITGGAFSTDKGASGKAPNKREVETREAFQNSVQRVLSDKTTTPENFKQKLTEDVGSENNTASAGIREELKALVSNSNQDALNKLTNSYKENTQKDDINNKITLDLMRQQNENQKKSVDFLDKLNSFGKMPTSKAEAKKFDRELSRDLSKADKGDYYAAVRASEKLNSMGMGKTLSSGSFSSLRDTIGRGRFQQMQSTSGILHRFGIDPENTLNNKNLDETSRNQATAALPGNLGTKETNAVINSLAGPGSDVVASNATLVTAIDSLGAKLAEITSGKLNATPLFNSADKEYQEIKTKKENAGNEEKKIMQDLQANMDKAISSLETLAKGGFNVGVDGNISLNVELDGEKIGEDVKDSLTKAMIQTIKEELDKLKAENNGNPTSVNAPGYNKRG